jgi:rifampicin phosphotransferase
VTALVDLADVGPADLDLVGGKGTRLGTLAASGLPVPSGFCVTSAVYDQLVAPRVADLAANADGGPEALARLARTAIEEIELPADLVDGIAARLAAFGPGTEVAVRSSATTEDGTNASFAGQFSTTLRVAGLAAVLRAVRACWASVFGVPATRYGEHRSDSSAPRMAVLVQPMVAARCAGVAFVPETAGDAVLLEAVHGTAERLVDGTATPERIEVDEDGRVRRTGRSVLSDAEARAVAVLGRRIRAAFAGAHDIEWALSGDRVVVLQDRPITAALPAQAAASSWPSPTPGARWARMSICDSWLPEPLSPLFATTLFPRLVKTWARNWEGRRGNALVPRPMHGTIEGYAYLRIDFPLNRHPWLTARLIGSFLAFHLSPVERRWRRDILPAHVRRVRELATVDVESAEPARILAIVDELETLGARYWAIIGGLAWYWKVGEWALGRLFPWDREDEAGAYAVLLQGADSRVWQAERNLYELARRPPDELAAALPAYLDRYGHLVYHLDFAEPTPGEQPDAVVAAVDAYRAGRAADPGTRRRGLEERREAAARTARAALRGRPVRRVLFEAALRWCRHWNAVRDEALYAFTLPWPALRRAYLEIGRRLAGAGALPSAADVFFLTGDEVRSWRATSDVDTSGWAGLAARRREDRERRRLLVPPPLIPEDTRVTLGPWDITDVALLGADRTRGEDQELRGSGVSSGRVRGPVRVLRSVHDGLDVRPGDVLVVSHLTPAWSAMLTRVAAVVTDVGGSLSHGSIVARELGVPAVMGTGNATRVLREGQVVYVDGAAGTVRLVEPLGAGR